MTSPNDYLRLEGEGKTLPSVPEWFVDTIFDDTLKTHSDHIVIKTLEGEHSTDIGEWIIRGVKGERLFTILMRAHPDKSWFSHLHHDGSVWKGWIIAGIDTPAGTVTYHLPVSEIPNLPPIFALDCGKEWGGHTKDDVMERLLSL